MIFKKIDKFTDIIYIAVSYWVYNDVEIITLSNYVKDLIAKIDLQEKMRVDKRVILVRFRNGSDPKL